MQKQLAPLLLMRFVYGLIFTIFETCFSMFNKTVLVLGKTTFNAALTSLIFEDAHQSGLLLAYVGVVFAFVQGFALSRLLKRWGEAELIPRAFFICGISVIIWMNVSNSLLTSILTLCPFALSSGS